MGGNRHGSTHLPCQHWGSKAGLMSLMRLMMPHGLPSHSLSWTAKTVFRLGLCSPGSWSSLCRPGWSQTLRFLSASQVGGLKVCATRPRKILFSMTEGPESHPKPEQNKILKAPSRLVSCYKELTDIVASGGPAISNSYLGIPKLRSSGFHSETILRLALGLSGQSA